VSEPLEFEQKWRELRDRFVVRLEERQRVIQTAWSCVSSGKDEDGEARSTLFHQIHSLAGSGATFGFIELSAAARVLEPTLDPARSPSKESLSEQALQEVAAGLEVLSQELRRVNPRL
jgi:chemotaxis protein histidine kinase CheA